MLLFDLEMNPYTHGGSVRRQRKKQFSPQPGLKYIGPLLPLTSEVTSGGASSEIQVTDVARMKLREIQIAKDALWRRARVAQLGRK